MCDPTLTKKGQWNKNLQTNCSSAKASYPGARLVNQKEISADVQHTESTIKHMVDIVNKAKERTNIGKQSFEVGVLQKTEESAPLRTA